MKRPDQTRVLQKVRRGGQRFRKKYSCCKTSWSGWFVPHAKTVSVKNKDKKNVVLPVVNLNEPNKRNIGGPLERWTAVQYGSPN